jgi:tetratricopeptide (TPR) repeat protein
VEGVYLNTEEWCEKGDALFNLGRYEEALEAYEKAIEIGDKKLLNIC